MKRLARSMTTEPPIEATNPYGTRRVPQCVGICGLAAFLMFFGVGCGESTKPPLSSKQAVAKPVIRATVASTPEELASAALQAIEAADQAALEKLLAVKKITKDVEAITQGRSKFQGMVDKAIPTAVKAIFSEINGLDKQGRVIDQASITGSTAVVSIKGLRAGKEQTRRLFLVQEDGQWRLVPSHR